MRHRISLAAAALIASFGSGYATVQLTNSLVSNPVAPPGYTIQQLLQMTGVTLQGVGPGNVAFAVPTDGTNAGWAGVEAESNGTFTPIVQPSLGPGAPVNITAAGLAQIGPNAVNGKQIIVSAWNIMSATTNSFTWGYGPPGCPSMTPITGAYSLTPTNPGLSPGDGLGVLFATPVGTALCAQVVASGTPSIAGHVSLTQQ